MKALVLHAPNTPFSLEEVPDPTPGPGEAVAKVLACGSGLTIQHVKAGRAHAKFPAIIGHEITAEIVALGAGVTGLSVGDAVTSYFYLNCGHCHMCHANLEPLCENSCGYVGRECDGGYAEYIKLPAYNFLKFPEGLDYKANPAEIGVVMDAIATPYKVLRRAKVKPQDTVAVFGAGGGLGIHQVMMAKWAGARVIAVDIASDKFQACKDAGADECVDPSSVDTVEALKDLTGGRGIDVAIDYVSTKQTIESAIQALGPKGRFVTLGGAGQVFEANSQDMLTKELDILGSRYVTRFEIIESLELVRDGKVWPIVTDIRPMAEAEAIHDAVEKGEVIGRAALLISN
jgi:D-arabinose 1-dehydrogenase-like Zn-dependent alcohol dehydrogenase